MSASTDRIERQVLLKAPRERVWRALTHAPEFGEWFGVDFADQQFVPGEPTTGHMTNKGYEHMALRIVIERIEAERLFSFRWHPFAIDATKDYSDEPMTLVQFELRDAEGGTMLTLVESGFDRVPLARRAEAFKMNSGGWDSQMKRIAKHVSSA